MTEPTITPDRSLGALVADVPRYATAFESLGIDYCCGGDRTLEEACAETGVALEDAREALATVDRDDDEPTWETASELIEVVVETHHEYLRDELPALEALVEKVCRVHGENHPELRSVESTFGTLAAEMRTHITDEEERAFPIIETLERGASLAAVERRALREELETFEADHAATADRLERIAALTNGYDVPEDACGSYRSMLARLEELEIDTHMHVHRENNVLFPEAQRLLADVE